MYKSSIEHKPPAWESNGYRSSSPKTIRANIIDKCRDKFSFVALFWTIHAQPLLPPHIHFKPIYSLHFLSFKIYQGCALRTWLKGAHNNQCFEPVKSRMPSMYPGCQRVFFLLLATKIERLWRAGKKFFPLVTIKKPSGTQGTKYADLFEKSTIFRGHPTRI